ncbi:MAG: EthD domain-containing protein [Candidatus Binataceae bacterium]|jgi:uncharacterized protein (TIGR02118 family)
MFKIILLLKRKPEISVKDFQSYWLEKHGPLVRRVPGIKRYVQSHPLPQGYAKGELIFDGVAEVWFESRDSFATVTATPEWLAVRRDGDSFRDAARAVMMPVDVHVIKDGAIPENAVKNIEFAKRRPDMDLKSFRDYWLNHHGPLAARIPVIRRYEQNHPSLSLYEGGAAPAFDGLAITWFNSTADMKQGTTTPEYAATRADEPNFIEPGTLPIIITREHVIVG